MDLVHAGMDGVLSARKETHVAPVEWGPAWLPAAIGAAVGATAMSLGRGRGSGREVAKGALFGSVLGLSCGVAWASRRYTGALARGARRQIASARDAHWLEKNPIDYA